MFSFPQWAADVTGCQINEHGLAASNGRLYCHEKDVWVSSTIGISPAQAQTGSVFEHKWNQQNTYASPELLAHVRRWALERYGDFVSVLDQIKGERPIVLDAGCGAGMTAWEYFGSYFNRINYIGVDLSEAVFIARQRMLEHGYEGVFFQDDICALPFNKEKVDIIFSEGVLHHTDSTQKAMSILTPLLKPGGFFMFYVYNKKGPVREFCDDYIRDSLQKMMPAEAWEALRPLTDLGRQLGEIDAMLHLPEGIPLLEVPPGDISLQRFFYWHIFKAFYDKNMSFEEMLHINFDWYAPVNAHRQTPEEIRQWCAELGLEIKRMKVEEAGLTVVAQKY